MERRKILVVDDDADWRDFLVTCLTDLGYAPVEASNGSEALGLLEAGDCSVVLLDLHMPGMSGRDVVECLPSNPPPIVFMTSADAAEVGRLLSAGAYYYLPKRASKAQLSLLLESLQLHTTE